MKTLFVIEDTLKDFTSIKENFSDWDIYPGSNKGMIFQLDKLTKYVKETLESNKEIVAIIVDIALINDSDDTTGIKLIRNIRNGNNNSLKNKVIPIFCFSKHIQYKKEALKAGATSFFAKEILLNKADYRYAFLEQSVHALSFLYLDAIRQSQNLPSFGAVFQKLEKSHKDNMLILNAVLQLLDFTGLDTLLESDEIENELADRLGEQTLQNLKKVKLSEQEKENLENQLNDIAGIIGTIPGLSPLAGILKGVRLLSKSLW